MMIWRSVSGFVTGCPSGPWCHWLTTYALWWCTFSKFILNELVCIPYNGEYISYVYITAYVYFSLFNFSYLITFKNEFLFTINVMLRLPTEGNTQKTHVSLKLSTLQWRHNGCNNVSNHQPRGCLLNRLFRRKSKKTPKLRVTGLVE